MKKFDGPPINFDNIYTKILKIYQPTLQIDKLFNLNMANVIILLDHKTRRLTNTMVFSESWI